MLTHEINGVRELSDDHPADAAIQITRRIHALALYIGAAVPERENTNYHAGERRTDLLNSDITAGAFDALAWLAALANFYACEAACGYRD
jgi:hypothetical protein